MAQRMSTRTFVLAAVCALIGLYALWTSYQWVDAMVGFDAPGFLALSLLAVIGGLGMIAAVPLHHAWTRQPRWARIALPILVGLGGITAAVCLWFIAMLNACLGEGVCRPVHTWVMLPSLLVCGALCALGPFWAALGFGGRPGATRFWVAAAILAVAGFFAGMVAWVEMGLYPG